MHVLFVSNYFPPEVNAPARRLYEHARQWIEDGHSVEVLTSVPNFPEGELYKGYRNALTEEAIDGIPALRVPMYIAENKGTLRRTLSYLSFMGAAVWYARRIRRRPDVVVATSPQFFCALGGYVISRLLRRPFVLEIRDLWPESIVAVGAMKRNVMIRCFEGLERFLYRRSDRIVAVTDAFKRHIVERGIPASRVDVIKNGAKLPFGGEALDPDRLAGLRRAFGLEGKFTAAYIGTIGMAHRVDILYEAAARCQDPDIVFMVVGTGAERARLEALQAEQPLPNFRLIDKQPKEMIPYILALCDVSIVHLKDLPLFRTVIPSKIFEAMATRTPIVLGVEGETREIIDAAGAGISIPPENAGALADAVHRLKDDPDLYRRMGESGFSYVNEHFDRRKLARRYWSVLESVSTGTANPDAQPVPVQT